MGSFCHIWYNTQVQWVAVEVKKVLDPMPYLSNYGNSFHTFYVFVVISHKEWVDFVYVW